MLASFQPVWGLRWHNSCGQKGLRMRPCRGAGQCAGANGGRVFLLLSRWRSYHEGSQAIDSCSIHHLMATKIWNVWYAMDDGSDELVEKPDEDSQLFLWCLFGGREILPEDFLNRSQSSQVLSKNFIGNPTLYIKCSTSFCPARQCCCRRRQRCIYSLSTSLRRSATEVRTKLCSHGLSGCSPRDEAVTRHAHAGRDPGLFLGAAVMVIGQNNGIAASKDKLEIIRRHRLMSPFLASKSCATGLLTTCLTTA